MTFLKQKKGIAALAAVAVVAVGAIGAYAYWTTGGAGTGSGATGATNDIVVNQTSTSAGLYPGGSVALSGNFTNTTNPGAVYITSVTATVDVFSIDPDGAGGLPACTNSDFSVSGTSNTPGSIPNGTNVGSWSGLSLVMTNSATNQDQCKTITVPLTYAAS